MVGTEAFLEGFLERVGVGLEAEGLSHFVKDRLAHGWSLREGPREIDPALWVEEVEAVNPKSQVRFRRPQ